MAQRALRIEGLPERSLEAAALFHAEWLPKALALLSRAPPGPDLVIVLPRADHSHRHWRLAAIQGLAREAAPARVNAVAGGDEAAVSEAIAWLADAPGITGQVLELASE